MSDQGIDTRLLATLTAQSQDLNSEAMRITGQALEEYTEESTSRLRWRRRSGATATASAATAMASGTVLLGSSRAAAAGNGTDVMALQTAASLENLAISVYTTAAELPFIKDGNKTIAEFIAKTTNQHMSHAQAFNAAAAEAGGKAQNDPDPKYAAIVQTALPTLKTPADVVKLAITLEDVAAQTYTANVSQVSDPLLRRLFASVAPVEAQHRAVLLAVQALLAGGHPELITVPTDAAQLPTATGSVGFPDAFQPTKNASPVSEGAVQ